MIFPWIETSWLSFNFLIPLNSWRSQGPGQVRADGVLSPKSYILNIDAAHSIRGSIESLTGIRRETLDLLVGGELGTSLRKQMKPTIVPRRGKEQNFYNGKLMLLLTGKQKLKR